MLVEVTLIVVFIGPFVVMYVETVPNRHDVCCIEESGLGDEVEAVHIAVADGETLAGWYAPPARRNGAVIMVLHGSRGDRLSALGHARVLHEAGYGVLVYDQRASGESTGERRSAGLYDQRDISPLIDWLASRPDVDGDRIGGVGLSLGAQILVLSGPGETRLRAIWSGGLGISTVDDLPPYEGFGTSVTTFLDRQMLWMAETYLGGRFTSFKQLIPQIAPRPLMLVAGSDQPFEADVNRNYEPYLGENGALWVIEGAPHIGGLAGQPAAYKARMLAFFDAALRP